jgi:type IV fimbrial biogenesis protein FimT
VNPVTLHTRSGFTMLELIVVMALIALLSVIAVPGFARWTTAQRLYDSGRQVDAALATARSEARRSGNVYLVFFGSDAEGNALADALGNPVPILVLNDGLPSSTDQNCVIDSGEPFESYPFTSTEVALGLVTAATAVPSDAGAGDITTGSSFVDDGGGDATWVMFRPDGVPLAFDSSCNLGQVGSGGGAIYLNNGTRDIAVVLTPLGATRLHAFNPANATWSE